MGTEGLERLVAEAAQGGAPDNLRDRYRGVLLGAAAGNALGIPVEGESRAAIRRRHPEGLTEVDASERTRPWDDDLAQTVILAESVLATGDIDAGDLAARFVQWARTNGRGMGALMREVVAELASGSPADEAAQVAWERSSWSTAGNAAVSRCSPIASRWRTAPAKLISAARTSALVTHYDARCEWTTVAVAIALAVTLSGDSLSLHDLGAALQAVGGSEWAAEALEQVAEAVVALDGRDLAGLELDDPMDMGYTIKAMEVGLWCLQQEPDFEAVVTDVVQAGGDTDTNGAIAGAMLGARVGASEIPPRWLHNIADTDRLVELADALYDVS